jgi:predicted RNA-binding Zn-ribbon protein involved in translation (DUF1610 family)
MAIRCRACYRSMSYSDAVKVSSDLGNCRVYVAFVCPQCGEINWYQETANSLQDVIEKLVEYVNAVQEAHLGERYHEIVREDPPISADEYLDFRNQLSGLNLSDLRELHGEE